MAVAAFGEWHALNRAARAVLDRGAGLPAHAFCETYSVLTGFPAPYRASPAIVASWLEDRFPVVLEAPGADAHRQLVRDLAAAGRMGGAIYDGLVGLTAKVAGATLVTADTRASVVYDLIGVTTRILK